MPTTAPVDAAGVSIDGCRLEQLTAAQAIAAGRFSHAWQPGRANWCEIEDWMVAEGWDPGYGDAQVAVALDKRALVISMLDSKPVSALSLLRVSEQYAFLGNYIVHPAFRGRGFGLATWRAVLPHAGARVIGLDTVPERLATYRDAGFTAAGATFTYQGAIARTFGRPADTHIRDLESSDYEAVVALDAACSPFERSAFLAAWLAANGTRTLVYADRGQVRGFGAIRPSRAGYRIGPLIAENPQAALALFDALAAPYPGELVYLNCPELNGPGGDIARSRGLERVGHTVRMYSHPVRPTAILRCFSTASLAWG